MKTGPLALAVFGGICLAACSSRPASPAYRDFYQHLQERPPARVSCEAAPYALTLLVDARHLDYTDNQSFFKTLTKHPDTLSKEGDVGHAWILLEKEGEVVVEGGHSGEVSPSLPRYFDGVVSGALAGGDNPIEYLWATRPDGFFQRGNGGHTPTFALRVPLTKSQFDAVLTFIGRDYDFSSYSLVESQCCTFVAAVAALAGLYPETHCTMHLNNELAFRGKRLRLWSHERFSSFTFPCPDVLEKSLMEFARQGKGEAVAEEYLTRAYRSDRLSLSQTLADFPDRWLRYRCFSR